MDHKLTLERGLQVCRANGYTMYFQFSNGRDACIAANMSNYMILADIDESGYGDRWCFYNLAAAVMALADWVARDGEGEPEGWHRHPPSGRRRPNGDPAQEYINW